MSELYKFEVLCESKEDADFLYHGAREWATRGIIRGKREVTEVKPEPGQPVTVPIDMILYCPSCGEQHIDAPEENWANPPHRSHLCDACGCIWRPADVATNGVVEIKTNGKADTWVSYAGEISAAPAGGQNEPVAWRILTPNGRVSFREKEPTVFEADIVTPLYTHPIPAAPAVPEIHDDVIRDWASEEIDVLFHGLDQFAVANVIRSAINRADKYRAEMLAASPEQQGFIL